MAYQFFAKAHQSKQPPTSPPISPPSASSPSSNNRRAKSPISPPSLSAFQPPNSSHASIASKLKPPAGSGDNTFQPVAYPHAIASGYPTPHPHVTIEPVNTAHIPSLSRITGLLLPIRYPNSFYTATITDPVVASVSRVAIYHDHPVAAAPATSPATDASTGSDKVIGGIRCRLEPVPPMAARRLPGKSPRDPKVNLYIQTLHLLSPYRSYGIAASLLNSLLFSTPPPSSSSSEKTGLQPGYRVSSLVRHYNIRSVTAHVHEANEEGLKWYVSRGFTVEQGVVENYYRKLKPSGARIVKLTLEWDDEDVEQGNITAKQDAPEQHNLTREEEDHFASAEEEDGDDDWEKVEADDEDEDDHGVQPFSDSRLMDADDAANRKRKADDEPQ